MIELTTALFLLLSTFSGVPKEAEVKIASTTPNIKQDQSIVKTLEGNKKLITFEDYIRDYYKDTPLLAEIARCESQFRHYLSDGSVVRGRVNSGDVGVMQINEYYHRDSAETLGYNIDTIGGNLAYAQWLFDREGSVPWTSSSPCWGKYEIENLVSKPKELAKK